MAYKKNEPYENLANAIIIQAASDYHTALTMKDVVLKSSCERFFRSDWFGVLTNIDPERLIKDIKKEVHYDD